MKSKNHYPPTITYGIQVVAGCNEQYPPTFQNPACMKMRVVVSPRAYQMLKE